MLLLSPNCVLIPSQVARGRELHLDFLRTDQDGWDSRDGVQTSKERTGVQILVVEDEPRLASPLRRGLTEMAHAVDLAADGEEALAWVDVDDYDVIVLDIMLPGIDGLELCRRLRRRRLRTPLLLLTARDSVADRVAGLDAGADDYLVKPFAIAELAARLRALARRPPETH